MSCDLFLRDSSVYIEAKHAEAAAPILAGAEFDMNIDDSGNITDVYYVGNSDNMCDDEELATALAPYMREGSFMEFCDEKGYVWRQLFIDGNCHCVYAVVHWPKLDAPKDITQQIQKAFAQYLMTE